ncbi:ABC transporter ATP-binding protein [Rhodohalobacter sp. 8-1]|uniref:ABC transporter ATP-binding protein n=1 Tax=Rhodohalobacter sp. 8-1 TaxID=3131972 RepID=UPI0030ED6B2B
MISIKNLSFAFKKNKPLFKDLSLQMETSKIYGLFGLNGAGKTTLLNHITGMLFPAEGECTVNGVTARERSPQMLSDLFLIPEQFDLPSMTGTQYTEIHAPFYPTFDEALFESVIDEFKVDITSKLQELSYGQRKKFLIAFALATNTRVLLMDEPTNGLDIPAKSQFRRIVASLDYSNRCIVISTHQVRDLGAMIDQVSVIKNGEIVFNHGLDAIQKNLSFKKIPADSETDYIYGEEALGSVHAVFRAGAVNEHASEELDMELLFNAIISQTNNIQEEFKTVSV